MVPPPPTPPAAPLLKQGHGPAVFAGSVAYLEAILAQHTRYANAMALTAFTVFTLAAVVVALGREHKAIQFGA